jgi:DNA-directed RNA polymerase subunit K/omega
MSSGGVDKNVTRKSLLSLLLQNETKAASNQLKDKDEEQAAAVSKVLSPFEQARALSFRAQQLSYGAKPHVEVPDGVYDSFQIATLELQQNKLRISLRRFDPCGAHEDVDVDTLIKPQTMYPDPTKPVLLDNGGGGGGGGGDEDKAKEDN